MQPLVSVAIPAYNMEKRIEATLRSVLDQDYENLEIILVDDASTDGTVDVARRVLDAGKRPWHLIEHEKNRGECGARNTGIEAAKGEYVWFMDSDDLADRRLVSTLSRIASQKNLDMAFSAYKTYDEVSGLERLYPVKLSPDKTYSAEDFAVMYVWETITVGIWAILYRKAFLSFTGLMFTEGCKTGGDLEFLLKSFSRAESVGFSKECLYTHILHDGMISRSAGTSKEKILQRSSENIQAQIRAAEYVIRHSNMPRLVDIARRHILPRFHLKLLTMCAWRDDRETYDRLRTSPEIRSSLLSSWRHFPKDPAVFLKALTVAAFPGLYYHYRKKKVYGLRV